MTKLTGKFYEPRSSRPADGVITLAGEQILLTIDEQRSPIILSLKEMQGEDNLYFEDGSYFHSDAPIPEDFRHTFQSKTARHIRWLEQWSWGKAAVYALALICFILIARLALIGGLDLVTHYFPEKWERFLGEQSYLLLKEASLNETNLPQEQRERLLGKAREIAQVSDISADVEIFFHASPQIGPNALAFPGGPIVVTDQLVKLMKNDEQVLSIIAHEFGHVRERHSLRQIIKVMGVTGLASLIFGANESFLEEILAVGIDLWALDNSRDHEREADLVALDMLRASNIDPSHMLEGMKVLLASTCGSKQASDVEKCLQGDGTGWLDTHPGSKERIDYLTEAIAQ